MGLNSSINGHRITTARAYIPAWGLWYVDCETDKAVTLSGAVTLVLADLTLKGAILAGASFNERSKFRVVAGFGGWGRSIDRKSYANDAGVKISQVVTDAATAVGEQVSLTTTDRVGPAYVRATGPACRVLESVAPSAWYVGEDGVTRLGVRPASTLAEKVTIQNVDHARGTVAIASDKIAKLLPGVTVEGVSALDVHHEISAEGIRTKLWGRLGSTSSRRLDAYRKIFDALDPDRAFRGVYEYRLVAQDGDRADLQAVRVSTGMPDLRRVPVRPGVAGCKATFTPGSRVLVGFVDADPARPFVCGVEEVGGDGFNALTLEIDATTSIKLGGGLRQVACVGDAAGPYLITSVAPAKVLAP